ncbi:peptide MFS transporter [Oerskovia enterophila]|uniref:Di-/tripeptide transporter n=1 Tax=Oerskovia enterophila TaxID=43678 RepID=A0A163RUV0_9CELL|nr:oligopeptide:H+ symporter [Oerskovia enterophila]KZM35720.1 Di-/tripeptide transporter [Oerskovia enterophila]OCI30672.1 Di-/tripeptide transporter [Oerskovia enterophila]
MTTEDARPAGPAVDPDDRAFFGHPRGLSTLFGLEVWERFSFLGMQAILVLFFTATVADDGLGMEAGQAASIAAGYGTMVYLVSVGGGWIADRVLGSYRAVLWGGILIACGHYTMAIPAELSTWLGLVLISLGTGLLKPNVSTLVGKLYSTTDERRDAGFALYYMGINVGAFFGPLVTGWLGADVGWHWGFSAAAIGMTAGVVQYVVGRRHIPGHGRGPEAPLPPAVMRRTLWILGGVAAGVVILAVGLALVGRLSIAGVVDALTVVAMAAPIVYFTVMFRSPRVTGEERGRLRPFLVLWFASVAFNFVLFQAYSVLILLADQHVERTIFGWQAPAAWFSSFLGGVEVLVAPVVAALWTWLGPRQPHASKKIAIGALLGGLSYLVLVPAVTGQSGDWKIAVWWLLASLLLLGLGDVLLQTTGLSATTKLAPAAFSSQSMAVWFLSIALANGIQAQTVRFYGEIPDGLYFTLNGAVAVLVAVVVLVLSPWMRRTMHPVH